MNPENPYGELLDSTMEIVTWNVWGRFGPYHERAAAITRTIANAQPDIIVLQESWATPHGDSQAEWLAQRHGLDHWAIGELGPEHDGWNIVSALVSRWPILDVRHVAFPAHAQLRGWPGEALTAIIDGPRGRVPLINVSLDWPPHASELRQASTRALGDLCKELGRGERYPVIVCGDFNAGPSSAELRMLTGEDATACPGFVLFDAWAKAGSGSGNTWDRTNRWAAPTLLPSRRIDYVMTGWPKSPGGGGDAVAIRLIGNDDVDVPASDHYGLHATLRY